VAIIRFDHEHAIAVLDTRREVQLMIEGTRNEGLVVPMIQLQVSAEEAITVNADAIRTVEDD
jgi:hypothetical protein